VFQVLIAVVAVDDARSRLPCTRRATFRIVDEIVAGDGTLEQEWAEGGPSSERTDTTVEWTVIGTPVE
jgi:hypothetical protein